MTTTTDAAEDVPARLLFVDDEPSILSALKRLFHRKGYTLFTATSGQEGLELLEKETVDLVISDMRMPEMDGAQFLEKVFGRWPDTKRILLTGYADVSSTIAAINQGKIWRYVSKPWDDNEILLTVEQALAHRRLIRENARLTDLTRRQNEELKTLNTSLEQKVAERTAELQTANKELHSSFLATVQVFSSLIELREGKLAGHSRRVADLARRIAERLGLDDAEQRVILLAGLLHDIGKVGLPDKLLERPFNALPPTDKSEVMRHPIKGQQLLMGIPQLAEVARIIRHHHEAMDGSGYPDQLSGLAIPLGARILGLANDYDGLQTGAIALHGHSPREAQDFILKNRAKRYDPAVVDTFLSMMQDIPVSGDTEIAVTPPDLRPGMVLTRDLMHYDGYLLLPKGRVIDAAVIVQLRALAEGDGRPWQIHIRRSSGPGVLRDKPQETVSRPWKELAVTTARLKEGMTLARNLYHHDGYLLLARGNALDPSIIRQLQEIEKSDGRPISVYIRVDDR